MIKANYFPILIFLFFGLIFGVILISIGKIVGKSKPDKEKNSPYECGFEAFENARMQFDIRYYLIAIIFILFDIEVAFLFPWAVIYRELKVYGFFVMLIFLFILISGFIYIWKKGALEWE